LPTSVTDIKESNSNELNTRFGINVGTREICKGFHLKLSAQTNTSIYGEMKLSD
jgi:hypothetical protein